MLGFPPFPPMPLTYGRGQPGGARRGRDPEGSQTCVHWYLGYLSDTTWRLRYTYCFTGNNRPLSTLSVVADGHDHDLRAQNDAEQAKKGNPFAELDPTGELMNSNAGADNK